MYSQKPAHNILKTNLPFLYLLLLIGLVSLTCNLNLTTEDEEKEAATAQAKDTVMTFTGQATKTWFYYGHACINQAQATLYITNDVIITLRTEGKDFSFGSGSCIEDSYTSTWTITGWAMEGYFTSDENKNIIRYTDIFFTECNSGAFKAEGRAKIVATDENTVFGEAQCLLYSDREVEIHFSFTLNKAP